MIENKSSMRDEVIASLAAIPPLTWAAVYLSSVEGFMDYYFKLEPLFPTKKEAYEALEAQYEIIFGRRRYSEWKTFRVVQARYLHSKRY